MSPIANNLQIRQEHVPKGTVIELDVETMIGIDRLAAGETRKLALYQPPVEGPVPLVVVYDGIEYQKVVHLPEIVDNLIDQERIQPIALAMVESVEESRPVEYTCSDATVGFIVEAVIPLALQNLNLVDVTRHPGAYGIIGASAGGSMALFTALRAPEIFGKVLSQSGFYCYPTFGELTARIYPNMWESVIVQSIKNMPLYPLQIWMDVGIYDWETILEPNERMFALLKNRGYDVTLRRFSGGHSYYA